MNKNTLIIHLHKNGDEAFEMINPEYNLHNENDGIWEFTICFEKTTSIKRTKSFEQLDVSISFNATVVLQADNLSLEVGKTMYQKEGYDYDRDLNLSNFYYFEHENI